VSDSEAERPCLVLAYASGTYTPSQMLWRVRSGGCGSGQGSRRHIVAMTGVLLFAVLGEVFYARQDHLVGMR
jgi:hypothetical protein